MVLPGTGRVLVSPSSAINVSDVKRPILARQLAKIAQLRKTSNGAGGPRRPLDAVKIGDRWYQYYSIPMYADAAQAMCENLGGNLLMLDNAAESQAVAQFVLQRLSTLGAEGPPSGSAPTTSTRKERSAGSTAYRSRRLLTSTGSTANRTTATATKTMSRGTSVTRRGNYLPRGATATAVGSK